MAGWSTEASQQLTKKKLTMHLPIVILQVDKIERKQTYSKNKIIDCMMSKYAEAIKYLFKIIQIDAMSLKPWNKNAM